MIPAAIDGTLTTAIPLIKCAVLVLAALSVIVAPAQKRLATVIGAVIIAVAVLVVEPFYQGGSLLFSWLRGGH